MARLFALLGALPATFSLLAWADEKPLSTPAIVQTSTAPSLVTGSALTQLMQLLFGLLLVVALIFLLAWLVRRVQQVAVRGNQSIQLLASQALGPRDRLLLVQVGEEQILLGLSPGRITPLHVLQQPVPVSETATPRPEFAQRLLEALHKGRGQ